jgi:hypothetical protein
MAFAVTWIKAIRVFLCRLSVLAEGSMIGGFCG